MKEFDKKSSPSREGFSKFLPASMSDSSTRRRLTEYEIQVQDLQAYIRSLEAETVHLRKKLEDTPKDFMVLENKLREANRQLVQAFNQNEKLVNALYEAREQITSLKEEVDKLCAPPSTYGVYLVRQRGRYRQHPLPGPQGEGQPAPLHQGRRPQARPGAHPQRGPQRRRGRRLRDPGRRRHPQGAARRRARRRHPARRRGEGRHHRRAPARPAPQDRRSPPHGRQERLPAREAPQERGRRPHPRGSARHRLRRHRRPQRPRSSPSRTPSSCRTSTPTTTRSTSSPRPRASSSTAPPAAARP